MSSTGSYLEPSQSDQLVQTCLAVLSRKPAALLTDIDGTISHVAATPDEAVVEETARMSLRRITRHLAMVGIVTGRGAAAAAALVGVPELIYIGNHGLERLQGVNAWSHPAAVSGSDAIRTALVEIGEVAQSTGLADGLIFEDKRLSASIHFRQAPDPIAAQSMLLAAALSSAAMYGLTVTEGRLVIELRPTLAVNKGTAIEGLIAEHRLQGVVFFGDDVTDADAFIRLRSLRAREEIETLAVGVIGPETPQVVKENSDITVSGVVACIELIAAIADHLDGKTS